MPQTRDLSQHAPARETLADDVPTVDAARLAAAEPETVQTVRAACRQPGFFFLDAGCDPGGSIPRALRQMNAFFGLDDADPRKQAINIAKSQAEQGWTPMFGELPYQPGTLAHVESFDCRRRPPPGSDDPPNQWPDLPGFRRAVRDCWDTLTDAGDAVLEGLALAAGLERRFFADRCNSGELNTLRLLHYPANDAPAAGGNVGISAHTDFECMTLIMQTAPGLELLAADGHWYDVPGHDGRLVVMLDDMLERWTNGHFRATGHRVRNTRQQRFSIVMFFAVNDDEVVAPLPPFVSDDRPPRYAPVRQREHLERELEQAARNRELAG